MGITSISLSGMNAAQTRLQVSAHNVANLNTEGFVRQEVLQSTMGGGGVQVSVTTSASGSGSDLAADVVQQLVAKHEFLANLNALKTGDEMLGNLLDITA